MSKKTLYIIAFFLVLGGVLGYNYYQKIFGKAITKDSVLFVSSNDSLTDVKDKLSEFSKNPNTFLLVAAKKNFSKPKSGRYVLTEGMSNNDIINMLRIGNQTPLKVSFNNQDTLEKFAGRIAEQLEIDSISVLNSFYDKEFLSKNKLTKKSVLQICIPNSYEFYWNISANGFRNKMLKEYNRFWNTSRLKKAQTLKMTQVEVIALASIVQKETAKIVEEAGFKGIWGSGLGISASLGVRDNNEASWTQVLDVIEFMSDATTIPILLDGDTGYGNFNNMRRLVKKLCQRGAGGVCIEDKIFPKTNSFLRGDKQPLADIDEFAGHMREVVREEEHRDAPTTRYGMPYHTVETAITPADAVTPTKHVLQALLAGENYPSGEDGRQAIEILVAAYQSAEQGGVTLDLDKITLDRARKYPWA